MALEESDERGRRVEAVLTAIDDLIGVRVERALRRNSLNVPKPSVEDVEKTRTRLRDCLKELVGP